MCIRDRVETELHRVCAMSPGEAFVDAGAHFEASEIVAAPEVHGRSRAARERDRRERSVVQREALDAQLLVPIAAGRSVWPEIDVAVHGSGDVIEDRGADDVIVIYARAPTVSGLEDDAV